MPIRGVSQTYGITNMRAKAFPPIEEINLISQPAYFFTLAREYTLEMFV